MELAEKIAVVTGASRGIGKAIATRLASEGVNLNFDRSLLNAMPIQKRSVVLEAES